jgi:hypothetical protein
MSKNWLFVIRAPQTILTSCSKFQSVRTGCWLVGSPDTTDKLRHVSMIKELLLVSGAPQTILTTCSRFQ